MFFEKCDTLVFDVHIEAIVRMINLTLIHIYGIENYMIMNIVFINMSL